MRSWVNDMQHGKGKFSYKAGGSYDGNWVNGTMEGFGKYIYQMVTFTKVILLRVKCMEKDLIFY